MNKVILGGAGCGAGFFVASRGVGSRTGLSVVDEPVWRFLSRGSNSFLESVARAVTAVGSSGVLLVLAAVIGAALWMRRRSVVLAVAPWVAVQLSTIVVSAAKAHFDVDRPPAEFQVVRTLSPAFPSGHAGNTAAFCVATAVVLGAVLPARAARAAGAAGAVMVTAVAWSRLELNVHWFSDVVGGALLGGAIGGLVAFGCLRFHARTVARGAGGGPATRGSDLDA